MRRMQSLICVTLAACLVAVLAHAPAVSAQKGTITCESYNNEYHHCYADTKGRVTLKQKLSTSDCVQGRTWGHDNTGVWVDRGCRAEFEYGREEGKSHTGRNVAIAGGVAGAIALALIISHKKDKQSYDKLSNANKTAYNKGWDAGKRDHFEGKSSDYTRWSDEYERGRESAFRSGYREGFEHGENKKRGSSN